jgi:hypothetical protein
LFAIGSICIGLGGLGLTLEVVLRFLPVRESLSLLPVNDANPIARLRPNRDITWSKGWNFGIVNTFHVNNFGFVNDLDYEVDSDEPLLAVVGDSYVEAAMVPYEETLQGRLAASLAGRARVYSFAFSGSALSQYLAFARFARDVFEPDAMIVVIVSNDFGQSFEARPGLHHFIETEGGEVELVRTDFEVGWVRNVARRFALARYLVANLESARLWRHEKPTGDQTIVGGTWAVMEPRRVASASRAIDEFLEELPRSAGLPRSQIVFVVDGIRPELYDRTKRISSKGSYLDVMRERLMLLAREQGHQVLDLQPRMIREFEKSGKHFEFVDDAHWNAHGHAAAARAVEEGVVFEKLRNPNGPEAPVGPSPAEGREVGSR